MSLEVRNIERIAAGAGPGRQVFDVATVGDHALRIAINEEPYPWHTHPGADELFIVMDGTLVIELETGERVELGPWDTCVVPAGVVHRTTPRGRTTNLLIEPASTETVRVER